jgi:hypothetical protein
MLVRSEDTLARHRESKAYRNVPCSRICLCLVFIDRLYSIGVYISITHQRNLHPHANYTNRVQTGNGQSSRENDIFFQRNSKGESLLPASCRLRASSATHLCGPVPARNADPKSNGQTPKGSSAPRARKPCPQSSALRLCRPPLRFALSTPLRSIARVGIPLSLQLLPPAFARWRSACMSHATATTTATTKEQRA